MGPLTARAAVLHQPGQPMTVEHIQLREPGHGEVVVRTASVGICGTDLHFTRGLFPYPLPAVLGHEASGIVEHVGPDVTTVKPGDRVLVCDQIPCGRCGPCLSGRMVYCADTTRKQRQRGRLRLGEQPFRQYLGVSALADLMLIDAAAVIPIPDEITFDAAALLGCCLTTGTATVFNTGGLRPGQSVLVIGCGGVGLSAVQAARIGGATRIIAADPQPHRREAALSLGATDTLDPATDLAAAVLNITGTGVDLAIEAVGDPALASAAFAALAPGGQAIVIGMMPPDTAIPMPGEPTMADIGISGFQGYELIREVRLMHRLSQRPLWLTLVLAGAPLVLFVVVLALLFGHMFWQK